MQQTLQPIRKPEPVSSQNFSRDELAFLEAESDFIRYHLEDMGDILSLGGLKVIALRDSSVLFGIKTDKSGALLRDPHDSLQDALNHLTSS